MLIINNDIDKKIFKYNFLIIKIAFKAIKLTNSLK